MDYISTTSLANELDKKPAELFEKLKILGWIERKNDKWALTDLGKQKGGQTRTSSKYGEFIVWPENISLDGEQQQQSGKSKLLNATAIGKQFNISSQRLNLIFSELGWIEKALVGQDVNGWAVTKLGKCIFRWKLYHPFRWKLYHPFRWKLYHPFRWKLYHPFRWKLYHS
jgi:hypothetical protein